MEGKGTPGLERTMTSMLHSLLSGTRLAAIWGHRAHRGRALQRQLRVFPSPLLRQGPLVPARSLSIHFAGAQSWAPLHHPLFSELLSLSIQTLPGISLGISFGTQVPERPFPAPKCRAEQGSCQRRQGCPRGPAAQCCRQASLHFAVFLREQPRKIL